MTDSSNNTWESLVRRARPLQETEADGTPPGFSTRVLQAWRDNRPLPWYSTFAWRRLALATTPVMLALVVWASIPSKSVTYDETALNDLLAMDQVEQVDAAQ